MKSWYQILHISEEASETDIKAAYRKLAKENHPDSHPGDEVRAETFKKVSEAYAILSDPKKRKTYDDQLHKTSKSEQPDDSNKHHQKQSMDIDFKNIHTSFENFFGFNAKSKEIVNEDKLKPKSNSKNPLDASDFFDKFIGIKR